MTNTKDFSLCLNSKIKLGLLFILLTNIFGKCNESDIDRGVKAVNASIEQMQNATNKNIANGTTSPEVGKRINDSLSARKELINTTYSNYKGDGKTKSELSKVVNIVDRGKQKKELVLLITNTLTTLESMANLYQLDRFKTFESAKFFQSGQYKISNQDKLAVLSSFDPLINQVVDVLKKDTSTKIKIIIMISGYSDAQDINPSSALYKELDNLTKTDENQDKYYNYTLQEKLNHKLSELRANSLRNIINEAINQRTGFDDSKEELLFEVNWIGRGVELPKSIVGSVNTPKKDDERRRIVTFMWDILPLFK